MAKRWAGPIGFEGVATGDNRFIEVGALRWSEGKFSLPLRYTAQDVGAHDGAQVVGHIDGLERITPDEANERLAAMDLEKLEEMPDTARVIWAVGDFDGGSEVGKEATRQVTEKLTDGISMDLDDISFEVRSQTMAADESGEEKEMMVTTAARIRAATQVAIPAFSGARIHLAKDIDEQAADFASIVNGLRSTVTVDGVVAEKVPTGQLASRTDTFNFDPWMWRDADDNWMDLPQGALSKVVKTLGDFRALTKPDGNHFRDSEEVIHWLSSHGGFDASIQLSFHEAMKNLIMDVSDFDSKVRQGDENGASQVLGGIQLGVKNALSTLSGVSVPNNQEIADQLALVQTDLGHLNDVATTLEGQGVLQQLIDDVKSTDFPDYGGPYGEDVPVAEQAVVSDSPVYPDYSNKAEFKAKHDPHHNWVEKVGGLPSYIKFLAQHIQASNPSWSQSRAIAVAVNVAKRWARGGTTTGRAKAPHVGAKTVAKAAAAVADWEAKKAASHVSAALEIQTFGLDPHQRGTAFLIANQAAARALGWKTSQDGCPSGTCWTDDEGWKITLQYGQDGPAFACYDEDSNLVGYEDSFPEAALSVANKQDVPDFDPDNDGDVDLPGSDDDPDDDPIDTSDDGEDENDDFNAIVKGIEILVPEDLQIDPEDKEHAVNLMHSAQVQTFSAQALESFAAASGQLQLVFDQNGTPLGVIDPSSIQKVQTELADSTATLIALFDINGEMLGVADPSEIQQVILTADGSQQQSAPAPADQSQQQPTPDQSQQPAAQQPAAQAAGQQPAASAAPAQQAAEDLQTFDAAPTAPAPASTSTPKPKVDPPSHEDKVEDKTPKTILVYDKDGNPIGIVDPQYVLPLTTMNAPGAVQPGQAASIVEAFRQVSDKTRKNMAKKGQALPDGSFPIATVSDLKNAIQSIGRAKDPAKAKAHIKKRAKALGQSKLIPDGWGYLPADSSVLEDGFEEEFETIDVEDLSESNYEPEQRALVASGAKMAQRELAAPIKPPKEWFFTPEPDGPQAMVVTPEGRIYGHLATNDQCHLAMPNGMNRCVTAPESKIDYAMFHLGVVETEEGDEVPTGRIVMKTRHADDDLNFRRALAHYENTGLAIADVHARTGKYGIWLSGALRPDATPVQIRALKASPLSGDWRESPVTRDLELLCALAVNEPGFPVPRPHGLVASGALKSLMAVGMLAPQKVLAPGTEGALSVDDLVYLKSLAQRERDLQGADLREAALQASMKLKVEAFAIKRAQQRRTGEK